MQNSNISNHYDKIAEEYIKFQNEFYNDKEDESRKNLYSHIDSIKGKTLLDIGFGQGKDINYYFNQGAITYGIDVSPKMIEIAKMNVSNQINLSVQSCENTNFPDSFFDIIISRYAIQYTKNLNSAFKEISRILKKDGLAVILVTHPLLCFMNTKDKNYFSNEIVNLSIYDGKITIKEQMHTFSDYFNNGLLNNFEIISFYENKGLENQSKSNSVIVPDYFILKLKKK